MSFCIPFSEGICLRKAIMGQGLRMSYLILLLVPTAMDYLFVILIWASGRSENRKH